MWNLLTDWVWIGGSLGFLPKGAQEDIQKRAAEITRLMNAAKDIVYAAQKAKRQLTQAERDLIKENADLAEKEINEFDSFYRTKFLLYGHEEVASALTRTSKSLRLQLEDFRQVAGITKGKAVITPKIEATVVAVHDGDTLTLDNGEIVRLVGIDAPESTTAAGQISRKYLMDLVLGKRVRVESDPNALIDIYNRRLGVIWLGETNINVEMLKQGYADFYEYEPNALVYKKVWQAAATEGTQVNIKQPLADLKDALANAKEKLRAWKTDARATAKLTIDAEKERYKSDAKEKLEDLKDDYAMTKEKNKDEHTAIVDTIKDSYKSKAITIDERESKMSEERTRYLTVRQEALKSYREAKLKIKDPYASEKDKLSALLKEEYKKIDTQYRETLAGLKSAYNESVTEIKTRKKIAVLPEVQLPTYTAPTVTAIAPEMPASEVKPAVAAVLVEAPAPVAPAPTPAAPAPMVKEYAKVMPWGSFWMSVPEKQGWTANVPAADLVKLVLGQLPFRTVDQSEMKTWKMVTV